MVTVVVPGVETEDVTVFGLTPILKFGPLPFRLTVCGPAALSLMVRTPLTGPSCVGVNVTLIVHFCKGASVALQVLVWANGPVVVIPFAGRVMVAEPELVRVTGIWPLVVFNGVGGN